MRTTTYIINTSGQSVHINLGDGIYEHLKPAQSIVYDDSKHTNATTYEARKVISRVVIPETASNVEPVTPEKRSLRLVATVDEPIIRLDSYVVSPINFQDLVLGIPVSPNPVPSGTAIHLKYSQFQFDSLYEAASDFNCGSFNYGGTRETPSANVVIDELPPRLIDSYKFTAGTEPELSNPELLLIDAQSTDVYKVIKRSSTDLTLDAVPPKIATGMFATLVKGRTIIPYATPKDSAVLRPNLKMCANTGGMVRDIPGPTWCKFTTNQLNALTSNEANAAGYATYFNASSRIPGNTLRVQVGYTENASWMAPLVTNDINDNTVPVVVKMPGKLLRQLRLRGITLTFDDSDGFTGYKVVGPILSIFERSLLNNKVLDKFLEDKTLQEVEFNAMEATFTKDQFMEYIGAYGIPSNTLLYRALTAFNMGDITEVTLAEQGTSYSRPTGTIDEITVNVDANYVNTSPTAKIVVERSPDEYKHHVGLAPLYTENELSMSVTQPMQYDTPGDAILYIGIVDSSSNVWLSQPNKHYVSASVPTQTSTITLQTP